MAGSSGGFDDPNKRLSALLASVRNPKGNREQSAFASSHAFRSASEQSSPFHYSEGPVTHGYRQPTVSSPLPTPPISNLPPRHGSAILTPAGESDYARSPIDPIGTARSSSASDPRTQNLLNLLKFSEPSQPLKSPVSAPTSEVICPPKPNDSSLQSSLLATLMSSARPKENQQSTPQGSQAFQSKPTISSNTAGPSSDTQDYLLRLLSQSKPAKPEGSASVDSAKRKAAETDSLTPSIPGKRRSIPSAELDSSKDETSEVTEALKETSLSENSSQPTVTQEIKPPQGIFTYVNPFEQLAASSPRNRSPKPPTPAQSVPKTQPVQILKPPRHVANVNEEAKPTSKTGTPSPVPPPTQIPDDSLIVAKGKETVSEALNQIGGKVDKEVKEALTQVEIAESQAIISKDLQDLLHAKTEADFEKSAKVAATDIKEELEKDRNANVLEEVLPSSVAKEVKDIIDEAAQDIVVETWEGADEAESAREKSTPETPVTVYDFPLKPFISITLNTPEPANINFPPNRSLEIAKVKREFDQADRTLVTASNTFVAFSMAHGGVRLARQEDGKSVKLFADAADKIFNIALSTSPTETTEILIGTGMSGTVYWAVVKDEHGRQINDPFFENQSFILPPLQASTEENTGGLLKTRARKSSRHPSFFAVGRGKFIHIIWPSMIMRQGLLKNEKDRVVDPAKFLAQNFLKINTGKAGKDFTFSQDDSVIVSLDKAGRVKFWDVRELVHADHGLKDPPAPGYVPLPEIKEPIMTYVTTAASEKAWPTSVLLVDKYRPYLRNGALRYLIVGTKQNHCIQLWDLGLGKMVQELHLPHENESDACCSIMFHPGTSMIIIGHPTLNKIYLIHLSAPKYNLPRHMTQADYLTRVAAGDSAITAIESTAVMSGIRSYKFAGPASKLSTKKDGTIRERGNLLSLDIFPTASDPIEAKDMRNFELYAMHTLGVCCLSLGHHEIGWNTENRLIDGKKADAEGVIKVDDLKETVPAPEPTIEPAVNSSILRNARSPSKDTESRDETKSNVPSGQDQTPSAVNTDATTRLQSPKPSVKFAPTQLPGANGNQDSAASGVESAEKKQKKKKRSKDATTIPASSTAKADTSAERKSGQPTLVQTSNGVKSSEAPVKADKPTSGGISQSMIDGIIEQLQSAVIGEMNELFANSLDKMYTRFENDKRTQAAVADAKQDAVLRLISKTLAENVDQSLALIVQDNMKSTVVPIVSDVVMKMVKDQLATRLNSHLKPAISSELHSTLPTALKGALQDSSMMDIVVKNVTSRIEERLVLDFQQSIIPNVTRLCTSMVQKAISEVQRNNAEQIHMLQMQHQQDERKFEQLTALVTQLSEMISAMATGQTKFQAEFLKLQQNTRPEQHIPPPQQPTRGSIVVAEQPNEEDVAESVSSAFNSGQHSAAIMTWLQLDGQEQQDLFNKFFSQYDPSFIRDFPNLMLLSIGVTLSAQLDGTALFERMLWLEEVFQSYSIEEEEDLAVPQRTIPIVVNRLEKLFMRVSQVSAQDPLLKRLSNLISLANRIVESTRSPGSSSRHASVSHHSAW